MIVISSREFRSQMGKYMRQALTTDVIIKSRSHGAFKLVPISDNDILMSKEEFFTKIEKVLLDIEIGNFIEVRTRKELYDLLYSFGYRPYNEETIQACREAREGKSAGMVDTSSPESFIASLFGEDDGCEE